MDPFIRDYDNEPITTKFIHNPEQFNKYMESENSTFQIFHMNIRSISKNIDELCIFLNQLSVEFDIIILTETFQLSDPNIFRIAGYRVLYNEGDLNKNDGIIMFVKENINYNYSIVELGDIKALNLKILNSNKHFTITAVYKSPSICPKIFNTKLLEYLEKSEKTGIDIIAGDLNMDLLSNDDYVEEYKNILSSFGFTSYINSVTRPQKQTCLDHFFVNNKTHGCESDIQSFIFEQSITDHYPTAITVRIENRKEAKIQKKHKKYIRYEDLKSDLGHEAWDNVYQQNNVDTMANNFIETLKYYINKHTKTVKIKQKTGMPKKKWITQGILKSVNEKERLYKNVLNNPGDNELRERYNQYRNKLHKIIKKSKKDYCERTISQQKNTSKALWDCVNDACNKTKLKTKIDKIELENGDTTTDAFEIANKFNEYYSQLGQKLASEIPRPDNFSEKPIRFNNTMFLYPTNELEVQREIKKLKPKKSPGEDNIRSETLKEISNQILAPLTYLINTCLDTGCFPDILKTGIIRPLHKSGSKLLIENYRPISLLSNIAKILERIIKTRIVKFFNKYEIISERQYGFREGKSTEDAIHKLTSFVYESLDKKIPMLSIFVDLSKAFDTVCHNRLLEKLEMYGLRGKSYKIIQSYLHNRTQRVDIEGTLSEPKTVTYGVPQGTVLGPLLFTTYINNLLALNTIGDILSFADDTVICYRSDSWANLKENAERDFSKIQKWFQLNKLTLNCEKTKYLPFTSYANNLPNMGPLNIGLNSQIPEAQSVKYLGIIVDRHLRWDLQIKNIAKKIRGLLYKFKYLKDFLSLQHLKTLYFALVQSQLSYGIIGWGGVNDCYLENLNVLQKWILKIIYEKEISFPSDRLFKEATVFDIRQIFCQHIIMDIYKNKISIEPIQHAYHTRNKENNLLMPRCGKTIGQRSCDYLGPRIYNILPQELRNINCFIRFKSKVKKWILENERTIFHDLINQKSSLIR